MSIWVLFTTTSKDIYKNVKREMLKNLRCPDCAGDIKLGDVLKSSAGEILEGSLICVDCAGSFVISEGIPIMLPKKFSNVAECETRNRVSEEANKKIDKWQDLW